MVKEPPIRNCPSCGREHKAWTVTQACWRCRHDPDRNGPTLAAMAREARLARRERSGL